MIVWSVRDVTGHRHAHGVATDIAGAWTEAGAAAVETAERLLRSDALVVEVDLQRARIYPGEGVAGSGPTTTLRDVVDDLVHAAIGAEQAWPTTTLLTEA